MLVWIVVILLLLFCWLYIKFTPKDADPEFVIHQASISTTKLRNESAIFRSLANDHGRALLGSVPPLKNFQFERLWDEVKQFKISVVSQTSPEPKLITNFEELVYQRQAMLGAEVVLEETNLDSLVTYFAAMLKGITPKLPDLIVENEDKQDEAKETKSQVSLHPALQAAIKANASLSDRETANEASDHPKMALTSNEISISEVDLGVAIASQLTAAGTQHRWGPSDTVFVAPGPINASLIVAMLTALSAKSVLLFAELGPMMDATRVLERARPTVLVTDDITMRTLAKQRDSFRLPQWVQYGFRRLRLGKGALTRPAMLKGFKSLRLIYSISGPDPLQWLDNGEVADLRVLTGTQVLHILAPFDGLPITQTCVGDYRFSSKLPGVNWGPPVPGLEIKTQGGALFVRRANHHQWTLVKTVEEPKLMSDGCLYVPVRRPIFSEEYFYTGELH